MTSKVVDKEYIVQWEETHIYRYVTAVRASNKKEAKRLVNSNEEDDERYAEFYRVKSIGRKKVSENQQGE